MFFHTYNIFLSFLLYKFCYFYILFTICIKKSQLN
nr:MAG TPA: hypothetical protein [Caudoviricetes sp.]DAR91503.1 MAG TPA: hypothetical protein [Caudoviricetes sp.]